MVCKRIFLRSLRKSIIIRSKIAFRYFDKVLLLFLSNLYRNTISQSLSAKGQIVLYKLHVHTLHADNPHIHYNSYLTPSEVPSLHWAIYMNLHNTRILERLDDMISNFYDKIIRSSSSMESNNPKILCVGLSCLDIIQTCKQYPLEDSDQRSIEYRWQRGGNASNTCTVLSLLGSPCEFLGVFSSEEHANFLQNDMKKYNIDFSHCPEVKGIGCPMSTVILSLSSGSRTILHHNPNLPELTLTDFTRLKLQNYSWIHFEARNITEVLTMMQHVENYNNSITLLEKQNVEKSSIRNMNITISVELEKPKSKLLDLLPYADVVFISKEFALNRGCDNMSEILKNISAETKSGATIICAWGDRGAMARAPDGSTVQSPAFPPQKIIDSLGAGDTFNAGVLHYLNKTKLSAIGKNKDSLNSSIAEQQSKNEFSYEQKGSSSQILKNHNIETSEFSQTEFINQNVLQAALTFACHVAGTKIGMKGYNGLEKVFANTTNF